MIKYTINPLGYGIQYACVSIRCPRWAETWLAHAVSEVGRPWHHQPIGPWAAHRRHQSPVQWRGCQEVLRSCRQRARRREILHDLFAHLVSHTLCWLDYCFTLFLRFQGNWVSGKRNINICVGARLCCLNLYSVAGSLEGLRQRPSSYQKLHYYSQLVYDFHAFDGLRRVARFRVTSTGSTEDYGKLDDDEQRDVWYKL